MSDKKVPSYLDVIINNYDELQSLKAEIERLRAAGDALDAALRAAIHDRPTAPTDLVWSEMLYAAVAWDEARRG